MIIEIAVVGAALAAGFGLGRVKNAGKLAAVKAEIVKAENSAVTDVKALIADIRSHI